MSITCAIAYDDLVLINIVCCDLHRDESAQFHPHDFTHYIYSWSRSLVIVYVLFTLGDQHLLFWRLKYIIEAAMSNHQFSCLHSITNDRQFTTNLTESFLSAIRCGILLSLKILCKRRQQYVKLVSSAGNSSWYFWQQIRAAKLPPLLTFVTASFTLINLSWPYLPSLSMPFQVSDRPTAWSYLRRRLM